MAEMDVSRYLCSQLVTLSWDEVRQPPSPAPELQGPKPLPSPSPEKRACPSKRTTIVNLEEIREGGGVLESEAAVPVDALVEIRCGTAYFAGTITHAEEHGFGWRISVEFSPLTPWSPERFRPEHLFDPAKMLADP